MNEHQRQEFFEYLDLIRRSGAVNMFGAAPYLAQEFGINRSQARDILREWMETFEQRHARA